MIEKDILRRLDRLQMRREEPVKIWYLYRMPDGSEQRMRWKGATPKDQIEQMRTWEESTSAEYITTIIEVKEGDHY